MVFSLFIIVTCTLLQSHETVAPSIKITGSGQQILDGIRVNSAPYPGSINGADGSTNFGDDEDADHEYDMAKAEMERAEENANKIAAKCSQPNIQRIYSVRDKCYEERDRAYGERDAARERFHNIRDGVGTVVTQDSSAENEDVDSEYTAAKAEMERAEAYADKMTEKCSQKYIQNNIRLRTDCYAERSRAYAARTTARDKFHAIRDGVTSGAPFSTGVSLKPASNLKPSSKKPSMSSSSFNGIGNGGVHLGNFDASITNYSPSSSPRPGRPATAQQHNLHGSNDDDDSEPDTVDDSDDDSEHDSEHVPSEKNSNKLGSGNTSPQIGTTNIFNNGNGAQIFTGGKINYKPFSGNKNIFNDNGDTYKLQLVNYDNDNSKCMEHWEIGLAGNDFAMWEPSFDVQCNGQNTRPFINSPDKVIVSNPDDSFCLYSNTHDSMTVIQEGKCTKFQYDNYGVQTSNKVLSNTECTKEKGLIRKLLKGGNQGPAMSNIHNAHGVLNNNGQSGNTGEHAEDGQSYNTQNIEGPIYNLGPHYTASISNLENDDACEDKIQISHKVNNGIKDEFIVPCANSNRNCKYQWEEILVGSPDDKFCAFSMLKMPKIMVVIQDGKCKKRTYTGSAVYDEAILKNVDCVVIKDKIKKIEAKLKSRSLNETPKIKAEIAALENELGKKLNEVVPAAMTHPSHLTPTPSGLGEKASQSTTQTNPNGGKVTQAGNPLGKTGSFSGNEKQNQNYFNVGSMKSQSTNLGNSYRGGMNFGGNNGPNINGMNFGGNDGWGVTWTGNSYQLKRRAVYEANGDCNEELLLIWNGEQVGKSFKPKCSPNQANSNVNNFNSLLIYGNQNDKFRIFSSKKNEYYYKQDGKWNQGNIKGGKIQEQEMSSSDVTKLEKRINKWEEVLNKNNNELKRIGAQQKRESDEYSQEMNRLSNLMKDENGKFQTNRRLVDDFRDEERQRQQKDNQIYNDMVRKQGWNDNVQNFQNEKQRRQDEGNKKVQAKYDEESARYKQALNNIKLKMDETSAIYKQQTTPKFQRMYDQESTRFNQEFNGLIAQGY